MKKYVIGVDLGGRSIKFGLFDTKGNLLEKSNINTSTKNNGENIVPDLINHINKIIEDNNLNDSNLKGIGIGLPGPVIDKKIVQKAVNLGWTKEVNISKIISDKTGFNVLVENDANVAALGEYWKGAAEGKKNIVMVTLGTGVGGGIIINGEILSGANGAGGEIGHIPYLENDLDRECGCGGKRCFEQMCSATGIEKIALEYLSKTSKNSSLRNLQDISAKEIFEEAKKSDEVSLEIVNIYKENFGRGLAIISAVVDPEMFVIGGGVSNAGEFLIDITKKAYERYAFTVTKNAQFKLATLGNDAGIYGAAKLLIP